MQSTMLRAFETRYILNIIKRGTYLSIKFYFSNDILPNNITIMHQVEIYSVQITNEN